MIRTEIVCQSGVRDLVSRTSTEHMDGCSFHCGTRGARAVHTPHPLYKRLSDKWNSRQQATASGTVTGSGRPGKMSSKASWPLSSL